MECQSLSYRTGIPGLQHTFGRVSKRLWGHSWLALPPSLSDVHEVFQVSMLQKYTPDPAHVVDWGEIVVDTDETFEEGPVRIMDSQDQVLRRKTV